MDVNSCETRSGHGVIIVALLWQWFGDLVTPSWWDDLWLNEGFASYMEYVGVDFVHPEWNMVSVLIQLGSCLCTSVIFSPCNFEIK